MGEGAIGRCVDTGAPVRAVVPSDPLLPGATGPLSMLAAPLVADGRVIGALASVKRTDVVYDEIDEMGVVAHMRQVIERAEGAHLHVSFDVDSMDPSIAPGTGTPVPGGLTYREGHLIMEMLHDSDLVGSLDIVEVNPYLDRSGETARLAVALIASLFGRKIMARGSVFESHFPRPPVRA